MIDKIPRFDARVDGETVFMRDSPTGTLVNTTLLLSALQRRRRELMEEYNGEQHIDDAIELSGRICEIKDIIRALGEEPL